MIRRSRSVQRTLELLGVGAAVAFFALWNAGYNLTA
ncbi:hypothetical protein LCGC14_1832270, partial [marine sediment metagenome]